MGRGKQRRREARLPKYFGLEQSLEFGIFDRSVRLLRPNCYTLANVSPAYAAPPSLDPYTNRRLGHQSRYRKRLTIGTRVAIRRYWRASIFNLRGI